MKRLALLLLILALILGGALWLYPRLFPVLDDPGDPGAVIDAPPLPVPDAALVAGTDPARDAGAEDAGNAVARAVVRGVRGVAQRRLPSGRWQKIGVGTELSLDDRVRTLGAGQLSLRLGNAVQVRLTSRTEVTIRELTERTSRVRIEEGRIIAEVNPAGRTVLRVEAKGSDAVAEASGGSFSVISDGHGQVAVAASAGSVKLSSGGQSVDVGAGTTSRVSGRKAPTAPIAIPHSLYLKVAAPGRAIQREKETLVKGRATPGSLVRVMGRVAMADARGRFQLKVPLREGKNDIEVHVTDVNGRQKRQKLPSITVDNREPTIEQSQVKWGAGDK